MEKNNAEIIISNGIFQVFILIFLLVPNININNVIGNALNNISSDVPDKKIETPKYK